MCFQKQIKALKVRWLLAFLLSIGTFNTSFAQEEFIEPPAQLLTRFSFRMLSGGVVLLKATVGNVPDTLNFILDTGSGGISLDSTTVEYFGFKREPSNRTIRGIAGIRKVSFVYNQKLYLPGLTVENLNFHIVNYGILSSVFGEPIDGIIGFSLLSRYIVEINYDSLKISLYSQGTFKYPRGGTFFKPIINALPVQSLQIKDAVSINSRFLYDIGAGLNLMLTQEFIDDSAFLKSKRKLFVKEAQGIGGEIDLHFTVIKELRLGPYRFRRVPTYIFDDVYNITSYPYLAGILGNDLLRRFNAVLDYSKRVFYLKPNSHFNEPFDYSYSGVQLYLINGVITIGNVAKGSPAERSGIKEGDVLIGINKNFTQNFSQYKLLLQEPGTKVKLVVQRDGKLLEFEFKIKNIL